MPKKIYREENFRKLIIKGIAVGNSFNQKGNVEKLDKPRC